MPQCFYADDGSFIADNLWGMQTCLETCWWVCHVLGIQMIIKGKKKMAWQGRCWVGGRQQDFTGVVVRLPNETARWCRNLRTERNTHTWSLKSARSGVDATPRCERKWLSTARGWWG